MMRGEFGEASSPSSLSRSPSSPLQTQSHHHSPKFYRNHYVFPGDSSYNSSTRFCLRSPSDYSLSSYFSNGLCSSEDGSSQFASPPLDGLMTKYNLGGDDLGLCESFHLLNVAEEEYKTHHQTQRSNFGKYDANGDGGLRFYSGFGVDQKDQTLLFPNQRDHQIPNLGLQSCYMNNYSVPVYRKSGVGTLFDDQGSSSNTNQSLPKVSEFQGYVYLMAKDQHGCRFLQRIFEDGSALDAMVIFNEVIPHVVELMMDPFGNYLMQKLLDVCNEEQRTQIILMVTSEPGQLIRISLNAYGTRVVQRLVESIKTRKQISLVKLALRPGFLNLIRDLNGNHVIQRCLKCLSTKDNEFIFEDATKFCIDIATHRHGCCVLQKCIAYSSGLQREKLVTEISRNSLFLAQDPYGNYAVQFVLELRDFSAIAAMLAQLKGHYVELSMQKFSSHMVERCLTHCPESRPQIVRELISVPHFDILIQDPYANFVIQAALAVTKRLVKLGKMTRMCDLPPELVGMIFTKIPITSIRTVRSTCKLWKALTKDWVLGKGAARKQFLGFMTKDSKVCSVRFHLCRNEDEELVDLSIKQIDLLNQVDISKVFHCDGLLLCVGIDNSRLIVWNPYLGQTKWIVPKKIHELDTYALGYDINRNHKILRFLDNNSFQKKECFGYEIYDFNSNSWRILDVTSRWRIKFHQRSVSLKGNSYFFADEKLGHCFSPGLTIEPNLSSKVERVPGGVQTIYLEDFLLCFDFTREKFGPRLPLPFHSKFNETVTLSRVKEEQLAVLYQQKNKSSDILHIWVTTSIEPNTLSWSKFLRVEMRPFKLTGVRFNHEAGSFFIGEEEKVVVVFDVDGYIYTNQGHSVQHGFYHWRRWIL